MTQCDVLPYVYSDNSLRQLDGLLLDGCRFTFA